MAWTYLSPSLSPSVSPYGGIARCARCAFAARCCALQRPFLGVVATPSVALASLFVHSGMLVQILTCAAAGRTLFARACGKTAGGVVVWLLREPRGNGGRHLSSLRMRPNSFVVALLSAALPVGGIIFYGVIAIPPPFYYGGGVNERQGGVVGGRMTLRAAAQTLFSLTAWMTFTPDSLFMAFVKHTRTRVCGLMGVIYNACGVRDITQQDMLSGDLAAWRDILSVTCGGRVDDLLPERPATLHFFTTPLS